MSRNPRWIPSREFRIGRRAVFLRVLPERSSSTITLALPTPYEHAHTRTMTHTIPFTSHRFTAHSHKQTQTHSLTHTLTPSLALSLSHTWRLSNLYSSKAREKGILTSHRCQRTGPVEPGWRRMAFRRLAWSFARGGWVAEKHTRTPERSYT